jgi:glutaredoxin
MKTFILTFSLLLLSNSSYGEIYKWADEQGKVHYSDQKPDIESVQNIELKINTYTHVTFGSSIHDVGRKVIMYSTDWCGYCKKARTYLKKNNIPFTEYDIEKDVEAAKRHENLGATGVPVILVGNKRMNGFSERGFERIYK